MAPKVKKRHKSSAESKATSPVDIGLSKPSLTTSSKGTEHAGESSTTCSICADHVRDWAVGHCAHVICGDCAHRIRVLYGRKACVMCNETLSQVAVVPLRHYRADMTFDEAVALPGAFQDKQVDMWFIDRTRHQQLRYVRGFKCSHKACSNRPPQECVFANATQLRAHARSEHRAIYCETCFSGKKLFVSEMPQYPLESDRNYSSRLRAHLRKEHPQCKFCRHYYLDDENLYAHLQERHETCSICERNGRMHEYYLNFQQLERHYAKEHYVCPHASCRGVVFSTQIELQSHEHSRHNESSRGNRPRALRVDLAQLHGARDPRRFASGTPQDVERERERQAARRRAFLSSNVVFSGAFNLDDFAADPLPGETSEPSSGQASTRQVPQSSQSPAGGGEADVGDLPPPIRAPDDGHFHPLELPRNGEELQARNLILVRRMRSLLDPAAYEQFKRFSGQFQVGNVSADEFYDAAVDAFGVRTAVREILPELVALLPSHLLREPLLRTCMRRTDTKPGDVGYLGLVGTATSSASTGTFRGTSTGVEQFPSLSGAPAPPRAARNMRRFGTPGPEEFPRLNRVNRTQSDSQSQPTTPQQQSAQVSYAAASAIAPAAPNVNSTHLGQRTAASVLRQQPIPRRIFANKTAGSEPRREGGSNMQIHGSAFPALTLALVTQSGTRDASAERNNKERDSQPKNSTPADVSMRVGAVWGGVAARAHERAGRKRGPGKSQGKRPASPPRAVVLDTSDFPAVGGSSSSSPGSSAHVAQRDASHRDPSPHRSSQSVPRKNKVIDVVEIARARQKATTKSNLPKIGGSGYGFSWDRKKVQRKKREIKEGAAENTTKDFANSNRRSDLERGSPSGRPTTESSEERTTVVEKIVSSAEVSAIDGAVRDIHIVEATASGTTNSVQETQSCDPYSYLKNDTPTDDVVASFLGGTD